MAGQRLEAMALIGLGFRRLSMAGSSIGPVKEMILGMDAQAVHNALVPLFESPDHSLREVVSDLAKQQTTPI